MATDPGVTVVLFGERTEARDPHEEVTRLHGYPHAGDQLAVWTGDTEEYVEVEKVVWPTPGLGFDAPKVLLRRLGGMTDDEWDELFEAIHEKRQP